MAVQQKLLSLWVWLLLMAALCPGARYVYSKRGGSSKGGRKGDDDKAPSSQGRGLSKQGLKLAGAAAAAGIAGGTGTGFGLGLFGKTKHRPGKHHGHKARSEHDQRHHQDEGRGNQNQSLWRAFVNAAAPTHTTNIFLTFRHVVSFLLAAWIRDI